MSNTEKRIAPRHPASRVPSITAVRLSPQGTRATLVNISTTGMLVETSAALKPTSAVTVVFEGTFTPSSMPSRVARTTVVGIGKDGTLRYQIGLSFARPIELEELVAGAVAHTSAEAPPPAAADPPAAPALPPAVVRNRW